jgi:uncharacterized protein (TIGR03437 family)
MSFVTRGFRKPGSFLFRFPAVLLFLSAGHLFSGAAHAQTFLTCTPAATNLIDRAEGLAEPSGDIVLNCGSGTAGVVVNANIIITYNVPVTNRLVNGAPDALVTVDTGNGPVTANITPVLITSNSLALNGISLTVPNTGSALIRISNVRLAVNLAGAGRQISASLSTTSLSLTNSIVAIASPVNGLFATYASTGITCTGSLLPTNINFTNLIATGTNFASTRITEGFSNAFTVKDATSDTGTRILLRFSNFPASASVYIPDFVVGNDGVMPTKAGDLGGIISAGAYVAGSGTLLLARVLNTDATGAGGAVIGTPASFTPGTVTQVPLSGGSGIAVYEVIDANNNVQENAQFPTFIGLPTNQPTAVATEAVSFGPLNAISTAMAGLPVPRFAAPTPPSDCQAVGDCGANYFPVLSATSTGLQFSVSTSGNLLTQFIQVNNNGGGYLNFTTSVTYQGTAQNWLTITNESGNANHTTLRLDAQPIGLAQGTYQATVTINAGGAGTATFPATFTIGPPQITISSIVNGASFQPGPLVAGSLATIKGNNLSGKAVSVSFGGVAGTVLYSSAQQINVQVPAALASNTSTQVVVTVDGNSSAAVTVSLAAVSPGIFGVLNQDNTVNSSSNPAVAGTAIQIFVTGLISPVSSGPVVVGLGNQGIPTLYSGGAPNGVQQVNAQLPNNASSIPGILTVCGTLTNAQLACSPTVTIYVRPN